MEELKIKLALLTNNESEKLIRWFKEQVYKKIKVTQNPSLNYKPYVKRRDVIWVDLGENVGQELSGPHPAIVIYSNDTSGTVLVVPLTKEESTSDFVIDMGTIDGMEQTLNNAKVDQIKAISKLRIQKKFNKDDNKFYSNYNRITKKFNNPKAIAEQMDKIDLKISKFREQSK